jgi:uncharacterized protein YggE
MKQTVSVRSIVVVVTAVAALVVAYLLGGGGGAQASPVVNVSSSPGGSQVPAGVSGTVTMTGTGEVTGVPDQMTFRLAVTRTAPDVATAMDAASRTQTRVLDAMQRAGVGRRDLQTTGLSIDPRYRYHDYEPPEIIGYTVRQSASVVVRDLEDAGAAVNAAVSAGGNAVRISGIALTIGDRDGLLKRARQAAVEDARAKAEEYVGASGESLGQLLTLKEGHRAARPKVRYELQRSAVADSAAMLAKLPVRAGQEKLEVSVSVVWALDDNAGDQG